MNTTTQPECGNPTSVVFINKEMAVSHFHPHSPSWGLLWLITDAAFDNLAISLSYSLHYLFYILAYGSSGSEVFVPFFKDSN